MIRKGDTSDPKGLIYEAYRIDNITKPECRTIFLDWALSLPDSVAAGDAIAALLDRYGAMQDGQHPMTAVLQEGQIGMSKPRRRGGWRSRDRTQ
ncbi:MAG: hypothetical protein AAFQ19_08655 [Pseudomonadota bacterium]